MESAAEYAERVERLEVARAERAEQRSMAPTSETTATTVVAPKMTTDDLPASMLPRTTAAPIVSERGALAIADAYACVRCLADSAASLPLHVYRSTTTGRVRADEVPAARLLAAPSPGTTTANLVAQLMAHLTLYGEAFVLLYGGPDGTPEQMALHPSPGTVSVETDAAGQPRYVFDLGGRRIVTTAREVMHVRGLSMDGVRGMSPIREAREALGLASALATHGSSTFANGGQPSSIVSIPGGGPAAEETLQNLKAGWEARHGGVANAGKTAFVLEDVKVQAVSMPLQDAEWIAAREASTREVARIFRLPPSMIGSGNGESLTYSTVSQELLAFAVHSLRPWLAYIEAAFRACEALFPPGSGLYPRFELDGLLRADPEARARNYTAALDPATGWMTRAEVRALEDLPAEEATA